MSKTGRILVTPTSFGSRDPALRQRLEAEFDKVIYNRLGRPLTSAELVELIPGIDGYIAGLDTVDRAVIEAADSLKVIARYGVGVDLVDLEATRRKGIVVTNTPGVNSISVAELTIGLLLCLARPIISASLSTRTGEWPRLSGYTLEGKTVGLVGLGSIGQCVAQRLQPFGCRLIAFDPLVPAESARTLGVHLLPLDQVFAQADFLSLHCPSTPDTRQLINAGSIAKMKPGAFLVNTARGELVDEAALAAGIQAGHLRGAALDVYASQPPGADNPLLALPQVIPTPHMGAHTDGAINAMGWGAFNDCLAVLRGKEPLHRVI